MANRILTLFMNIKAYFHWLLSLSRKTGLALIRHVPNTAMFASTNRIILRSTARSFMVGFEELSTIDQNEKKQLRRNVYRQIMLWSSMALQQKNTLKWIRFFSIILLSPIAIWAGFAVASLFLNLFINIDTIGVHPSIITPISLITILLLLAFAHSFVEFPVRVFAVSCSTLLLSLVLLAMKQHPLNLAVSTLDDFSATALAILSIYTIFTRVIFMFDRLESNFAHNSIFAKHSHSVLVVGFLFILYVFEKSEIKLEHPEITKEIINALERIAQSLGELLPKRTKTGDPITDSWYKTKSQQAASAVRELKKLLLFPTQETQVQFADRVKKGFIYSAEGNIGSLEFVDLAIEPINIVWRSRIIRLLRSLFIGFLPWVVLYVIQQSPFAIASTELGQVQIGALIWTILNVISILDPYFDSKMSALKDLSSILTAPIKSTKP